MRRSSLPFPHRASFPVAAVEGIDPSEAEEAVRPGRLAELVEARLRRGDAVHHHPGAVDKLIRADVAAAAEFARDAAGICWVAASAGGRIAGIDCGARGL